MTTAIGNIIADSLQLGLSKTKGLLVGVTEEMFARLASPGGVVVKSNHASFVLGHLAIYPARIVEQLGGDATALKLPESFVEAYSPTAKCLDDPEGTIYPPMQEVVDRFFAGYEAALVQFRRSDDELFLRPNPTGGRSTELFPTIGSMHAFYAGGHMMLHLGQLSAWRRMSGLGEA
ncbi:DinB family protein [Lacipirellula sp.]|uniref:DinB family protein n=1 Tax=Lacipirellula sp. TaxID=2691419 RepID=UPI003D0D9B42